MSKLKNFIPLGLLGLLPSFSYAMCPVCTVAVAGGVGFSRYLGIDDTIAGLWIGALTVSMIMWTINWLTKKNWRFAYDWPVTTLVFYATVIGSLYWAGMIHPLNQIWGMDKILFGTAIGSILFVLFAWLYLWMKKRNNDRAHFPFEKVVLVIVPLIVMSFAFYFLTK